MYEIIKRIRQDEYARNRFIEKYKPFLASITSSLCHRYVRYGEDEELSIALLAFNESIDRYNGEGIFFEYAKTVVRSRLLDYFKSREYKERNHESIDEHEYIIDYNSKDSYNEQLRKQRLKEEVEILSKELRLYNIEFEELYEFSPKHIMTRNYVNKLVVQLLDDTTVVGTVIDKGQLPTTYIIKTYNTTKKKIEPYRKYIMSLIIICNGQFELLYDYLPEGMVRL